MESIMKKAHAKINLGLDVICRRPDGYHEVKMVMQTVNIFDELTFTKAPASGIRIITESQEVPANENNLIHKAAAAVLRQYCPDAGVTVSLKKNIPVSAGMAGGSADAAAVFHGLDELFNLKLSLDDKHKMGLKIGADVPYCIMGGTALAEGIGEKLTPLPAAPACHIIIVKPDIIVSTRWVYENLHADRLPYHPDIDGMVQSLRENNLTGITKRMGNVLETVTARQHPIIHKLKKQLIDLGAENALMSGSGPTVFGIYTDPLKANQAFHHLQQKVKLKAIFLTTFV